MPIETAQISLQGDREVNQDRCSVVREGDCVLLLLADGMGGHPRGEVAAQILVNTGRSAFESIAKPIADPLGFLDDILRTAHQEIVAYGQRQEPPIDPRATAVTVLLQDGQAYWTHVGDSRFYLFRRYQALRRTRDHSFVEQLRNRGLRVKNDRDGKRYRNLVTQCLGSSSKQFAATRGLPTPLKARDILLLCSDGLWGQVADAKLGPQMRHHGSLERMVHDLANSAAQRAAPASDNVTLVALRWPDDEPAPATATAPAAEPATQKSVDELQAAIDHLRAAIDDYASDD